jgi:hypothetical protein
MSHYHKILRNTARIARAIDNAAVCRTLMRSILTAIITHAGGYVARSPQIATADLTFGVGALADLFYTSMVARSVCAMPLNTLESNHKLGSPEVESATSSWINKLSITRSPGQGVSCPREVERLRHSR